MLFTSRALILKAKHISGEEATLTDKHIKMLERWTPKFLLRRNTFSLYKAAGLVHRYRALLSAPIYFIVYSHSLHVSEYFGQLP